MEAYNKNTIVQIQKQGSPDVLEYNISDKPKPSYNQILLRQESIGLNFVDTMFRSGIFPLNQFPAVIGVEASGVIEAIGEKVTGFDIGDRVSYYFSLGAYAEYRLINPSSLIKLPKNISFDQAAAITAKGLTARMLVKQAYSIKENDIVLVHAAAGGVGSLVSRWAKSLGATVIGTVGRSEKKFYAQNLGIDHVIALDTEDLNESVKAFTNGKNLDAVYDGVGNSTFNQSIQLLKNGGSAVLFGTSSGEPQIDSKTLNSNNIQLIRPNLGSYFTDSDSVQQAASEMFEALENGILGDIKPTVYALKDVAQAHQDLQSGKTTGSIIFHI